MSVFEEDMNPHSILEDLRLRYRIDITKDALIIFDEAQFCNATLTSMKFRNANASGKLTFIPLPLAWSTERHM